MVFGDELVDEDYMMKQFDRLNSKKRVREENDQKAFMMDELVTYTNYVVHVPLEEVVPKEQKLKEQPNMQEVVWDTLGEPSKKYDFLVKQTKLPSSDIPFENIS